MDNGPEINPVCVKVIMFHLSCSFKGVVCCVFYIILKDIHVVSSYYMFIGKGQSSTMMAFIAGLFYLNALHYYVL